MRDVVNVLLGAFGAAIIVALFTLALLKLMRHAAKDTGSKRGEWN